MRLTTIRAKDVQPIQKFEVSNLSDVVVLAGPNGIGKSRLVERVLAHLQSPGPGANISVVLEATDPKEERLWSNKALDTSIPGDGALLQQSLQRSQYRRRKVESSVLYFESDRSIQQNAPFSSTSNITDRWDEQVR